MGFHAIICPWCGPIGSHPNTSIGGIELTGIDVITVVLAAAAVLLFAFSLITVLPAEKQVVRLMSALLAAAACGLFVESHAGGFPAHRVALGITTTIVAALGLSLLADAVGHLKRYYDSPRPARLD